jgi:hypothetical protein
MLDPALLLALPGNFAGNLAGDFASGLLWADLAPPEDFMRLLSLAALLAIGVSSALALAGSATAGATRPGAGTGIAIVAAVAQARSGNARSMHGAGAIAAP